MTLSPVRAIARRRRRCPDGNASTSTGITAPKIGREYSVTRGSVSCSLVNTAAPSSGPASASTPPSNAITSASTERGIASVSGEMLPLEKAYRPPASPANPPAQANASHCVRRASMPIASARKGESRTARSA